MLASAPDARFDDPDMVAMIAIGALVGPGQALLKECATAQSRARLQRERVLPVRAYLQARRITSKRAREEARRSNA